MYIFLLFFVTDDFLILENIFFNFKILKFKIEIEIILNYQFLRIFYININFNTIYICKFLIIKIIFLFYI